MTGNENEQKLQEQLIEMTDDGIRVIHEEVGEGLRKKKLSASLITGIVGDGSCPARWLADTFVIRKLIGEDPTGPARRGSLFHKVMEDFFALEPEERTHENIREIARQTLADGEFADLKYNAEVIEWLRAAVNGYYNMLADSDPKDVVIAEIEREKGTKKGLEVFVIGRIGKAEREVLGFVDRVQQAEDESLIIEDWKSGAKAKHFNPRTKDEKGWAEQRQQLIYTLLLEGEGFNISAARLIYPVAQEVVDVDVASDGYRSKVIADVEQADKDLTNSIENNLFEYSPSVLCAWCPIAKICPSKKIIYSSEKVVTAYEGQPDPDELSPGIRF